MAEQSYILVDFECANLDELRRQYPEVFARPYNEGSGLVLERLLA